MGVARTAKIVTTRNATAFARMPGNRDWVSVVECISASGRAIDPIVAFKGKKILQNWIPTDVNLRQATQAWSLACSPNAFTDDDLGLRWLRQVFEPATRSTGATAAPRLLILDGHHSHLAPDFQKACEEFGITTVFLPPHTSHVTQPLDVGCFGPIKQYYGQALDRKAHLWGEHIVKEHFLEIYSEARTRTFQERTIRGGFRGAGLVPLRPSTVIDKQIRPITPPDGLAAATSESVTPTSPRTLERTAAKLQVPCSPSTTLRRAQRIARGAQIVATTTRMTQDECAMVESHMRQLRSRRGGQGAIKGLDRVAGMSEAEWRLSGGSNWANELSDRRIQAAILQQMGELEGTTEQEEDQGI